ncbi:hypothetical protein [Comamonas sp. 4034]|uniref:hypothetical protein n=1 Tax=Comamonas sp. 4034 TaxID=3156455 RepID=UPI003D2136A2
MTTTTERKAPDFMQIVAREKLGEKAKDWQIFRWERIGDGNDFVVGFGQTRLKTSGKNKGETTWRGIDGRQLPHGKVVVTGAEMDAARAKYETDTGHCGECGGTGQAWCGWSAAEGTKYRTCHRCNGTGKAQGDRSLEQL